MRAVVRWALAAALLLPACAHAHPHVMIDSHAVAQFEHGKIVALLMGWKFDPVYSSSLVHDFDKDKNGILSAKEIAAMEKEAFSDTQPLGYLTYAKVDGVKVEWPKATDFKVLTFKNALLYSFRLNFPQPVDPRSQSLRFSTYEETFFIDIDFPDAGAIKLIGEGAEGCRATMAPDPENAIFGGAVIPKKVEITCAP